MNTLKLGSTDPMVKYLQRYLAKVGYSKVTETGIYDEGMVKTVSDYQAKMKLGVDGKAGRKTMESLLKQFKGLTDSDITEMANELKIEKPAIQAIYTVESGGFGFLPDGRPKVLFEGHVFWKLLDRKGYNPEEMAEEYPDLIYKSWTREHYLRGMEEWMRLGRARLIDNDAGVMSASFGTFQIMGVNYKLCGYTNVDDFLNNQFNNEVDHLRDLGNFIKNKGLLEHLQNKEWAKFARGYNGPAYKKNKYDEKLEAAFEKYS